MRRTLVLFLALASSPVALPQNALTNDDIIKMVKGGLPDDVILVAIESQPSNFDISAQALIALKQQGASKAILDRILEAAAANQRGGAPAKTVSTPAPSQPPSQAPQTQAQGTPPANTPNQGLSPADEEFVRALAQQVEQMRTQPSELSLSQLLDPGLIGADLPAPYKTALADLFAPYSQPLHQFVDQAVPLLRQKLSLPSTPVAFLGTPSLFARPARWTPVTVSLNESEPVATSRWRTTSWPHRESIVEMSYPQTAGAVQGTSSPGQQGASISQNLGNGVNVTIGINNWVDTQDTVATGGGVQEDVTVDPNPPVRGLKSVEKDGKVDIGARVNRCPDADGKDPGTEEDVVNATVAVTATTGTVVSANSGLRISVTSEGHVGDDARLRDVVVEANYSEEKGTGSSVTSFHWGGTATFDPHGSETKVPLQFTYCSRGQVNFPASLCGLFFFPSYFSFYDLQSAYLKAERKWSFVQYYGDRSPSGVPEWSKCVIAKFTPATKTVQGQPGQTVNVKTELITAKGHQPTWGIFKELQPIFKETIEENGTPTTPDAQAELTYTAALQPWPCNNPPGFGVYRATSRAGVLFGGGPAGYTEDEWTWFLAPSCMKLSVHERTEVEVMVAKVLTDVTFPMDLNVNQQGQLVGQAVVQRQSSEESSVCFTNGDRWVEQWHASGTLDSKTDILTLKLWFESTARQGTITCPTPLGPMIIPSNVPGFRSDAFPSPLDHFTLSDKEGATLHIAIPFPVAKHTVDVTVVSGLSSGAR
jgi:hypothetical protein